MPAIKPLILIVIDGLTPSVFEGAVGDSRTPSLTFLAEHGRYDRAVSTFPSLTPVCLSSLATGGHPDVHHIPHLVWYHRDEKRIVCRKRFTGDEFFFAGHYPQFPLVPGVLLCEAAMQAGAVLLSHMIAPADNAVPVATRMNDVRFKRPVRPGETIEIEVELSERLADAFFLKAKVICAGIGGALVAQADMRGEAGGELVPGT